MDKRKIGIVQCSISSDRDYNLNHALSLASGKEVDFIVFPELFTTGYELREDLAEDDSGKTVGTLSSFAKENKCNVIGGSIIERQDGRFYNTSYVFNRQGDLVGKYSKRNLFRPLKEDEFFTPGLQRKNNGNIFVLDDINVGVLICYDLRFSSMLENIKYQGAGLNFCPMQWPDKRTGIRECFVRARAAESYSFMVAANITGCMIGGSIDNLVDGHSSIAAPTGDCIFLADNEDKMIVESVDLDLIEKTKRFFKGGK